MKTDIFCPLQNQTNPLYYQYNQAREITMKIGQLKRYYQPYSTTKHKDELVMILSNYHGAYKVMVLKSGEQICGVNSEYLMEIG